MEGRGRESKNRESPDRDEKEEISKQVIRKRLERSGVDSIEFSKNAVHPVSCEEAHSSYTHVADLSNSVKVCGVFSA